MVHNGVAEIVSIEGGGTALRVHADARSLIAAGVPARLAGGLFQAEGGKDPCGGDCAVAFDDDSVWCESWGCDVTRCECHLRQAWKDGDGHWHDEDRGTPGPGSKHPRDKDGFYRCICKPKPQRPKKKPKKKPSKKTTKPHRPPRPRPRPDNPT